MSHSYNTVGHARINVMTFTRMRRVPSPNRYMAVARFCFCKNNKRTIIIIIPSISASLQTLGRFECAVASAPAPHGLRIISPLTLSFLRAFWTPKKIWP
jgi:hypothetical protein